MSVMKRFLSAGVFAAFLAAIAPMLTACTVNPATGRQSFTAFMSRADEIEIGREEHPKILKEFGGRYKDRALAVYVDGIGNRLAAVSEENGIPYTFTILNDDKVNAFALPGGYVYITRGLMALAENEAEMAGVLAHEIGHVVARHTAERYSQAMATNIGINLLGILGSAVGAPGGVGNLVSLGAQAILQGYSREQELESDMLAVRYLSRTGYDTNAMTSFFHKMQAHGKIEAALRGEKKDADAFNIMSSHPRTVDRINQAIRLARAQPATSPRLGRDEYLRRIDGLMFGDDPEQGIRRGRVFAHPGLRIRYQVPPGFIIANSPSRVVARNSKGAAVVFDMENPKKARGISDLRAYLTQVWGRSIGLRGVEGIDVNGMTAVTGYGRVNFSQGGIRDVRLVAIRGGPNRIFRLLFASPPAQTRGLEEELQRTTYSFRRLSDAEAAATKPLRIRVVPVRPGDTVAALAAKMPFERLRMEWFLALNGSLADLPPEMALTGSRRVKIVGD